MTCHETQLQLSLYLYGELEFAAEEAVENHLASCAFCQRAFAREKTWHTAATSEHRDVPLDLLAQCRSDLRHALTAQRAGLEPPPARKWQLRWPDALRIRPHRWSYQLAVGSFLVFLGYFGGRLFDGAAPLSGFGLNSAGMFGSERIRDIQPDGRGQVRIVLDRVNQREVIGRPEDQNVRRWLLIAVQDSSDPGIRVDSVEMLSRQGGVDVRDALVQRVLRDPNAAVRLKALECLRRFSEEPETRIALRSVLERDTDPAVRSEAIDVLASLNDNNVQLSPELAATLQDLARSDHDDYVRGRCLQLLRAINAPLSVY